MIFMNYLLYVPLCTPEDKKICMYAGGWTITSILLLDWRALHDIT